MQIERLMARISLTTRLTMAVSFKPMSAFEQSFP
jgi:hypothetical protein